MNILRGFSALLVLVFHIRMEVAPLQPYLFWAASYYLFVDMFFMLSGFIMMAVYAPQPGQQMSFPEYRGFIYKRFARIYPLHLLTMMFILAMFGLLGLFKSYGLLNIENPDIFDGNPLKAIVTNLLLIHSWGVQNDFTFNTVSWSISVEWAMYLVFPLLLLLCARVHSAVLLAVSLGVYLIIYYVIADHHLDVNIKSGLVRAFAGFVSGLALFRLTQAIRSTRLVALAGLVSAVAMIAALSVWAPHHWLFVPAFWGLIYTTYNLEDLIDPKVWWVRIGNWLGDVSYSMYLWHLIMILMYFQALSALTGISIEATGLGLAISLTLFLLAAIFTVSHLSYTFFEKPVRDTLRKMATGLRTERSGETMS